MSVDMIRVPWKAEPADDGTARVRVASLRPGDSPRAGDLNARYVRSLADLDVSFPPIIVHWPSMRVIDGMHRLRAATLRGEDTILVRWFKGDEHEAFVIAVHENVVHGLPLTLAERKGAAVRILQSHPHWSDRRIAIAAGLSHKTVSALRQCATGANTQLTARTGRDGRVRPLNSADGRRIAADLLAHDPAASLRDIARSAGISTATVRDVRARLRRGQDPVPAQRDSASEDGQEAEPTRLHTGQAEAQGAESASPADLAAAGTAATSISIAESIVQKLSRDPALRYNEKGRGIIRWLHTCTLGIRAIEQSVPHIPAHRASSIAHLARVNARSWLDLAQRLEQ